MKKVILFILFCLPVVAAFATNNADSVWLLKNYTKKEFYIPVRDGARLYTAVYIPKDKKTKHPFLLNRSPYSIAPYGRDSMRAFWNTHYISYFKEHYIVVLQDVRGRYMSEGTFEDIRPYKADKVSNREVDEASDTYDSIEWLLKNIGNNNGKVGVFGISYPGFYATMAALSQHPAVKAVSPQAPVTDWFAGDDFHHNGAFMLMDAFNFYSSFGKPRPAPTKSFAKGFDYYTKDSYKFYLETGTLRNFARLMGDSIAFWKDLYQHPDYDQWWQTRDARRHVSDIPDQTHTLVVGGLFDAEDCFGAWNLYKAIEEKANNDNKLVMGPWSHGGWARGDGSYLGNVRFGSATSKWYQEHIEIPYFNYYLKGKGNIRDIKEANIFFTGTNEWKGLDQWPPKTVNYKPVYLRSSGFLSTDKPSERVSSSRYVSDPSKPVPYAEHIHQGRTREYMTDDQRFAARRTDVLVFESDTLDRDLTIAGPVVADLFASISTTDADFIVKIIDVFPDNFTYNDSIDGKGDGKACIMGGYQMLVRAEVMRGRYRNSLSKPEPFEPGQITEVKYTLPDVAHVFKKGHKMMVQIQSTWFPLVDRNPQQFINIYKAEENDFMRSNIRIYHDRDFPSRILLPVMNY